MSTHVALIRGINVGGKNLLPMAELVSELRKLGLLEIQTYIQSGNAVFVVPEGQFADVSVLAAGIADCIFQRRQFRPHVIVLKASDLYKGISGNPFKSESAEADGKALHVFVLDSVPQNPDKKGLAALAAQGEKWALQDKFFYLYSPEGFHKSKLAARVEKLLGVPVTARNWRSVRKICELADS